MGRYKRLEIEGILIEDFGKEISDVINDIIENSEATEADTWKKISPHFEGILSKYEDEVSTFHLEHHSLKLENFLKINFQNQSKIATAHKESFTFFILYINSCYNVYDKIVSKLKRKRIDSTLKMCVLLYGLIIRRSDEILSLLLSGYVDGAMIIWRSLYENAVILMVIALENNADLSDRYFQHSLRNSKKKLTSFNKNHEALKFPKLSKSIESDIHDKVENTNTKYGKDFLNNEYGWADDLFDGKQRANFVLLEEKAEFGRFRPYYIYCCEQAHSSFNGFQGFIDKGKVILPRIIQPDYELNKFIDPMQFTISILHEINDFILYEFSTESEYNVNLMLMRKIFESQQKSFDEPKGKKATL